jgi:hypothetical protein
MKMPAHRTPAQMRAIRRQFLQAIKDVRPGQFSHASIPLRLARNIKVALDHAVAAKEAAEAATQAEQEMDPINPPDPALDRW